MAKLVHWMKHDIRFTSDEDEARELATLLVKGPMRPMWEFLAERIKLKNDVEIIRKNLKVKEEHTARNNPVDEESDEFELGAVSREVQKSKKLMSQLTHDVKRLQKICNELESTKNELGLKLKKSASQVNQVMDHEKRLQKVLKEINQKSREVSSWNQSLCSAKSRDIHAMCDELKPLILQAIKGQDGPYLQASDRFCGVQPKTFLQNLVEYTRSVAIKSHNEDEKIPIVPKKGDIEKVLKGLYECHLESKNALLQANEQCAILELENGRLLNDNIQDETLNRMMRFKQICKAAKAMVAYLQTSEKKQILENCDDIVSMSNLVGQRSKEVLGLKLTIEDLLSQVSNHEQRVLDYTSQIRNRKHGLSSHEIDFSMTFKRLGLSDPQGKRPLSIDRCLDPRFAQTPSIINLNYKCDLDCILSKVTSYNVSKKLKQAYLTEMEDFDHGDSLKRTLGLVISEMSQEHSEVAELLQRKLANKNPKERNHCEKFLQAIKVWTQEPARDAYVKSIRATHKGLTLIEWTNHMRE